MEGPIEEDNIAETNVISKGFVSFLLFHSLRVSFLVGRGLYSYSFALASADANFPSIFLLLANIWFSV